MDALPYLTLRFDPDEISVDPQEPSDFAYEVEGQILSVGDDDKRNQLGRFRVFYIDADAALNEGHSIFDVLDTDSATAPYIEPLYGGPDNGPSKALLKLLGEELMLHANTLILDRLEILPEFRGRGIGLAVLRRLILRFSAGTGMIAMKPFPLQFEAKPIVPDEWRQRLRLDALTKRKRESSATLFFYYAKLGFKRLPGTEFMFLATDRRLATLESLLPKAV